MSNKNYTSIMIDIVDSRKLNERDMVQGFMKSIIEYLNKIFYKSLKKPLMFSAGDEIQGLFNNTLAAYLCVRFCVMICYPIKIRSGIGFGALAFDNDMWVSSELDGEAYHNARYAIESFSDKSSFGIRFRSNTKSDKYLNAMFYSSQLLQRRQSSNAQNIKLIAELLFPIYDERIMVSYMELTSQLNNILAIRGKLKAYTQPLSYVKKERINHTMMRTEIDVSNQNIQMYSVSLHEILKCSDMMIENTWKKGMSTMISEILGTTRQNIDKHIRLGTIEENRSIDFSIACWILEEYGYE